MSGAKEIGIAVGDKVEQVSGLLRVPNGSKALLVLAHGAGAGMRHKFMDAISERLAEQKIATLRYQFPYMEKRIKRPDSEAVLTTTVRAAAAARSHGANLPLFAGGKSMGGRMTSLAAAKAALDGVRGLIFLGFPLHAAGKPGADRDKHLADIEVPMFFLQGSRDPLADLALLKPLCRWLGKRAELLVIEGGDHSFHMLKSSMRSDENVLDEVAAKTASWIASH